MPFATVLSQPRRVDISAPMETAQIAGLAGALVALVILVPRLRRMGGGTVLRAAAAWLAFAVALALAYRLWAG